MGDVAQLESRREADRRQRIEERPHGPLRHRLRDSGAAAADE